MQVHELTQGTQEWLAFRATHFGASEAAAMLGLSKTMTRSELLHMKATGLTPEFTAWVQKNVLDYGHHVEELTLPLIEARIGDDLYPATCSDGKISASCDGLSMLGDLAWENKQPNAEILAQVQAGQMPEQHMPQCQQVLMVTGASKLIFSVSDGTSENLHTLEVLPDPAWFERLRAGWAQFELDLATYTPPAAAPVVVAEPVQALPAVLVQVQGEITVTHNFGPFEVALRDFLEHRLIRAPKTDQDFADLDVQIKAMKGAEAALESSEVQMVAQVQPIDQAKKTKDMLLKLTRDNRLMAEKLLASEKERRRTEIVTNPAKELREHIATLNRELGAPYIPMPAVDFGGAIKGMRSLSSMEDAVATRLANAKIDANAVAATVRANLKMLADQGGEFGFLFADKNQLVLKASDDFNAVVSQRITQHKAEVKRKEEETRERIRLEEEAKAAAASRAALAKIQGIQNQVQAAQGSKPAVVLQIIADTEAVVVNAERFGIHTDMAIDAKRQTLDQLRAMAYHPNGAPRYSTTTFRSDGEPIMLNEDGTRSVFCDVDEDSQDTPTTAPATPTAQAVDVPAPAANVVPMRAAAAPVPAAPPATPPTLKLGEINLRLTPIQLSTEGLRILGFEPAGKAGAAVLFHERDFPHMCAAVIRHVESVQAKQAA
ncbi:putative phage-type endonuclease [compost metagenome]